jgi:hypothetical protein
MTHLGIGETELSNSLAACPNSNKSEMEGWKLVSAVFDVPKLEGLEWVVRVMEYWSVAESHGGLEIAGFCFAQDADCGIRNWGTEGARLRSEVAFARTQRQLRRTSRQAVLLGACESSVATAIEDAGVRITVSIFPPGFAVTQHAEDVTGRHGWHVCGIWSS